MPTDVSDLNYFNKYDDYRISWILSVHVYTLHRRIYYTAPPHAR